MEKQIEEMANVLWEYSRTRDDDAIALGESLAEYLIDNGYRKASEVAREFRQRMNDKMGKHTHLLGKEYVQRIMREIEKEFSEVEDG